jgi:hypothetical protein
LTTGAAGTQGIIIITYTPNIKTFEQGMGETYMSQRTVAY